MSALGVIKRVTSVIPRCARLTALLLVCAVAWGLPLGGSVRRTGDAAADRFGEIVFADSEKFEYLTENADRP